jgi:hypothetical protein
MVYFRACLCCKESKWSEYSEFYSGCFLSPKTCLYPLKLQVTTLVDGLHEFGGSISK